MTQAYLQKPERGSICSRCGHDLYVRIKQVKRTQDNLKGQDASGRVYCSNSKCTFYRRKHPTGPDLNLPPK